MALTDEQRENITDIIESEGFEYAFECYSSFDDVDDEEFHELRRAYLDAMGALADYINGEE